MGVFEFHHTARNDKHLGTLLIATFRQDRFTSPLADDLYLYRTDAGNRNWDRVYLVNQTTGSVDSVWSLTPGSNDLRRLAVSDNYRAYYQSATEMDPPNGTIAIMPLTEGVSASEEYQGWAESQLRGDVVTAIVLQAGRCLIFAWELVDGKIQLVAQRPMLTD